MPRSQATGSPQQRVAITGIGALCAAGLTFPAALKALYRERRDPAPPRRFELDQPRPYPVFALPPSPLDNDPADFRLMRTTRILQQAALEALADAGLEAAVLKKLRVGVCIGTTVGGTMNDEPFYRDFRDGKAPSLEPIHRFRRSNPAFFLARKFALGGPFLTVVNACSSGTDALGIGASWIKSGLCDLVLAGGSDELCRVTGNGFISLMITDDRPCRPFDRDRGGLNLGEGAAVLILEKTGLRRRKRRTRAYLEGYGNACDAWHLTAPHPEGRGLRQALENALAAARRKPEEIAFINAHGTATRNNDLVEGKVLKELFPATPFLSTKGHTGHTLGAAGALEAAFTVGMLERRKIPASAGFRNPDPEIGRAPVTRSQAITKTTAVSQSLAFGGNNAALVLTLAEEEDG